MKEDPLESGTACFWTLNLKVVIGLALPPLTEVEDWDKTSADC